MFWTIDGEEVEIVPRADGPIEIIRWDAEHKAVHLPAGMTKDEAIWAIRHFLASSIAIKEKLLEHKINLFDRFWPVISIPVDKNPYIHKQVVYYHIKGSYMSWTQREELEKFFLVEWVTQCVSYWEEYFNVLIPEIKFRRNRNAAFRVNKQKAYISFDSDLIRFTREHVDYCVFLAICVYLALPTIQREKIAQEDFPNKRSFDKILDYEYNARDND